MFYAPGFVGAHISCDHEVDCGDQLTLRTWKQLPILYTLDTGDDLAGDEEPLPLAVLIHVDTFLASSATCRAHLPHP